MIRLCAYQLDFNMDPLREAIFVPQVLQDITGVKEHRRQFTCWLHQDRHPSGRITRDGKRWKCYQCGAEGSIYDIAMLTLSLSFRDAKSYLYQLYGFSQPNFRSKQVKRQLKKIKKERELEQAFNDKVNYYYSELAAMHRALFRYDNGQLGHISFQLNEIMDELMSQDPKRRVEAVRFAEAWWCN